MAVNEVDDDNESIVNLYKDDNKEFKPFTFQHYSRVYDLKKSQFAHVGADLSDSDVLNDSGFGNVPAVDETLNED
jgi:3-deoxy-D-manno-octulosonate 8-phosphate phosphatase KdsC-like HAD superfamily phosphatase